MAKVLGFDPYARSKRLHPSMGHPSKRLHPSMGQSMQPPANEELAAVLEFRPVPERHDGAAVAAQ